jgi:hypothetical protein
LAARAFLDRLRLSWGIPLMAAAGRWYSPWIDLAGLFFGTITLFRDGLTVFAALGPILIGVGAILHALNTRRQMGHEQKRDDRQEQREIRREERRDREQPDADDAGPGNAPGPGPAC